MFMPTHIIAYTCTVKHLVRYILCKRVFSYDYFRLGKNRELGNPLCQN